MTLIYAHVVDPAGPPSQWFDAQWQPFGNGSRPMNEGVQWAPGWKQSRLGFIDWFKDVDGTYEIAVVWPELPQESEVNRWIATGAPWASQASIEELHITRGVVVPSGLAPLVPFPAAKFGIHAVGQNAGAQFGGKTYIIGPAESGKGCGDGIKFETGTAPVCLVTSVLVYVRQPAAPPVVISTISNSSAMLSSVSEVAQDASGATYEAVGVRWTGTYTPFNVSTGIDVTAMEAAAYAAARLLCVSQPSDIDFVSLAGQYSTAHALWNGASCSGTPAFQALSYAPYGDVLWRRAQDGIASTVKGSTVTAHPSFDAWLAIENSTSVSYSMVVHVQQESPASTTGLSFGTPRLLSLESSHSMDCSRPSIACVTQAECARRNRWHDVGHIMSNAIRSRGDVTPITDAQARGEWTAFKLGFTCTVRVGVVGVRPYGAAHMWADSEALKVPYVRFVSGVATEFGSFTVEVPFAEISRTPLQGSPVASLRAMDMAALSLARGSAGVAASVAGAHVGKVDWGGHVALVGSLTGGTEGGWLRPTLAVFVATSIDDALVPSALASAATPVGLSWCGLDQQDIQAVAVLSDIGVNSSAAIDAHLSSGHISAALHSRLSSIVSSNTMKPDLLNLYPAQMNATRFWSTTEDGGFVVPIRNALSVRGQMGGFGVRLCVITETRPPGTDDPLNDTAVPRPSYMTEALSNYDSATGSSRQVVVGGVTYHVPESPVSTGGVVCDSDASNNVSRRCALTPLPQQRLPEAKSARTPTARAMAFSSKFTFTAYQGGVRRDLIVTSKSPGLPKGALIGIVIGGVVLVAAVIILVVFLGRRAARRAQIVPQDQIPIVTARGGAQKYETKLSAKTYKKFVGSQPRPKPSQLKL